MEGDLAKAELAADPALKAAVVAATIGSSVSHVYKMVAKGEFPEADITIGAHFTRWRLSTVRGWLDSKSRRAGPRVAEAEAQQP